MKPSFIRAGEAYTTDEQSVAAPYFRRVVAVDQPQTARLRITAAGFYRAWLNGEPLGEGRLAPYISAPSDALFYDDYTLALRAGRNALCVQLGNGLQNNPGGQVWDFDTASWRGAPCFACRLELADGRVIESDERFLTKPSPVRRDDLRRGETYDARTETPDWLSPDCDESGWRAACLAPAPAGELLPNRAAPIIVETERKPVAIVREPEGWRYDFGANMAGVCRLRIRGQRGQRIVLDYGELLEDGRLSRRNLQNEGHGWDDELQRDVYICKGEDDEGFTPAFTYHGFRYVLARGLVPSQATPELLTALDCHTRMEQAGAFSCGHAMVNRVQELALASDKACFQHHPVDCPQREKNGWTADAALSCEQMLMNFDVESNLRQWMLCLRKAQRADGAMPGIVPTGGWGFAWGNGPAWDDVLFELPYQLYRLRWTLEPAREQAGAMLAYLRYLSGMRDERGLCAFGLGDWCHVGRDSDDCKAPLLVTDTIKAADMARKTAELLDAAGVPKQAAYARGLHAELRSAFRKHLLDPDTLLVAGNCQTSQAMALFYGMLEPEEQPRAYQRLLSLVAEANGHMDVGVLGGRVLFRVLNDFGDAALALSMITREDFPSYGNWVARGATTLWECFQPEGVPPLSLNHHFWGDVSGWFYQALGGLRVGYRRVDVQPAFLAEVHHAEAGYRTPAGEVRVTWRFAGEHVLLQIDAPTLDGRVRLPAGWTCGGRSEWALAQGSNLYECQRKDG